MKVTRTELRKIIKEELENALGVEEGFGSALKKVGQAIRGPGGSHTDSIRSEDVIDQLSDVKVSLGELYNSPETTDEAREALKQSLHLIGQLQRQINKIFKPHSSRR